MKRKIKNSKEVAVSFSPWTDKGDIQFSLFRLHIKEALGGEIPRGEIELVHPGTPKSLEMVQNQETGTIEIQDTKEGGFTYKFNVFITKRNVYNEIVSLEFICIPTRIGEDGNIDSGKDALERGKNFYTRLYSETYSDIEDAILSSYPGTWDKRVKTNISDKVKIYRDNETSYDLIKRLGFAWKNNSVFALGWDGLLNKEITGINSFGDSEDGDKIRKIYGDQKEWTQVSSKSSKYNTTLNTILFDPWQDPYKDDPGALELWKSVTPEDKYKEYVPGLVVSSITGDRDYKIHSHPYYLFEENLEASKNFYDAKGYGSIVLLGEDMPRDWKLGDTIMYYRKKDDKTWDTEGIRCIVASNELFFSQNGSTKTGPHGLPFEWTTVLWATKEASGNWAKEIEENKENKHE